MRTFVPIIYLSLGLVVLSMTTVAFAPSSRKQTTTSRVQIQMTENNQQDSSSDKNPLNNSRRMVLQQIPLAVGGIILSSSNPLPVFAAEEVIELPTKETVTVFSGIFSFYLS